MPTDADAYQRLARALDAHRGDAEAYRRLGPQMTARRHLLDPRYGNRRLFVRERLVPLGLKENAAYKLVYDLENGRLQSRGGFSPGNMLILADAYGVTTDAIVTVLDGGDLESQPAPPSLSLVPPISLERGPNDLLPDMDAEMRRAAEAHVPAIEAQVLRASATGPLTGARIFPNSPHEAARWDLLVQIGQGDPSGPYSPWQLVWMMSTGRALDDEKRAGTRPAQEVLIPT